MALQVGSRLGHYDVTALIGEGGMGQVYRATDTQLGRDVALKILPDAFAADPDRLARFQREAQVLASLNHPGIDATPRAIDDLPVQAQFKGDLASQSIGQIAVVFVDLDHFKAVNDTKGHVKETPAWRKSRT